MAVCALLFATTPLLHLLGRRPATKRGKYYLVNGWILTEADVDALNKHFPNH
jgi:hypothetical protein